MGIWPVNIVANVQNKTGPCQTSLKKLFMKIVNRWIQSLNSIIYMESCVYLNPLDLDKKDDLKIHLFIQNSKFQIKENH